MKIYRVFYLSVFLLIGFCVVGLTSYANQDGDTFTYCSTDVPKSINDNSTVTSNLNFPAGGIVEEVKLSMKITHTFNADLDITLESPDGSMVEVMSDNGGLGDGLGTTCTDPITPDFILDDNAANPVSTISGNMVTGSYIPENPLSTFQNEPINGTWKLHVTDDAGGDQGTLDCWCLEITGNSDTLTIVKETVPEGFVDDFDFEGTGFPGGNPCEMFSLSDGESQGCGQELGPGVYGIIETGDNGADIDIYCEGTQNWVVNDSGNGVIVEIGKKMCEYVDIDNQNSAEGLCCDYVATANGEDGLCCELPDVDNAIAADNCVDTIEANEAEYVYGEVDEFVTCTFTNTLPLELSPIFPAVESNPNFMTAYPVTSNGPVGFIWGFQLGSFFINLPCGQVELGINPFIFLGIFNAGANQIVNMAFYIALGGYANPAFAQAVDLTTCVVSDVVPNIILNTNLK